MSPESTVARRRDPDAHGYFGAFGGRFVPETLVEPVEALERAYMAVRDDPGFMRELDSLLEHYVGRPTPVYEARRLSAACEGARIFLKREDLTHTGAMPSTACSRATGPVRAHGRIRRWRPPWLDAVSQRG
jgi:tryptophan synthase beta subunit